VSEKTSSRRGSAIAVLLAKSTKLLKLAKLLKLLKFSKIIIMISTMALSAAVYSFARGPAFAIGLVLMIFIHEMGHVIALKMKGYKASLPIFIPMLGAVIFAPNFEDREKEAFVGYGGPLLGTVGALATFGLWKLTPSHPTVLLSISFIASYLNFFNLIPVRPLDGGRITQAIGSWFKYIGIAILLALPIVLKEPGYVILWILMLGDLNIHPKMKVTLGLLCETSMIVLMCLGFGEQSKVSNYADVVIVTIFNLMFFLEIYFKNKVEIYEEGEKARLTKEPAQLSNDGRIKWLLLYVGLAVMLIWVMIVQVQCFPEHIK
jgi:Zn-dependent protease